MNIGKLSPQEHASRLVSWGHWFCLANILLAQLFGLRYLLISDAPATALGIGYMLLSWLGHFAFLGFALYLLFVFPLSVIVQRLSVVRTCSVLIATAALTLMVLDGQLYAEYRLHLSPAVLALFSDDSIGFTQPNWSLALILLPFIFAAELALAHALWRKLPQIKAKVSGRIVALVFAGCFILTHSVHMWADAANYSPITAQKSNLPLSYPLTAKTLLAKNGLLPHDERQSSTDLPDEKTQLRYPINQLQLGEASNYNLLVVMLHGWRADAINPQWMPNTSAFAQQMLRFNAHYSAASDTDLGIFSLFYGVHPSYWQAFSDNYQSPVLIDLLQQQDYEFGLFSSDGFLRPSFLQTTFTQVDELDAQNISGEGGARGDTQAVERYLSWQQDKQSPWFGFVYLDNPAAMDLSQTELASDAPNREALLTQRYQQSLAQVDSLLGLIYQQLEQSAQLDNTIVVITGDHGYQLNDYQGGRFGYGSNYSAAQLQTPLLLHIPGVAAAEINNDSNHQDIVATLIPQLFAPNNKVSDYSSGTNLLKPNKRQVMMLGNGHDLVLYDKQLITIYGGHGDVEVRARDNYQRQTQNMADLRVLVPMLEETKRFYRQ